MVKMKYSPRVMAAVRALALLLLGPLPSIADVVIVQKTTNPMDGNEMTITMNIGESMMRVDVGDKASTIIDNTTGDITTLSHEQKASIVMPGAQMEAMMKQAARMQDPSAADSPAKLTSTGKKEKIAGFETEEYAQKTPVGEVRYWVAKDYPNYKRILEAMTKFQSGALGRMAKSSGLPQLKAEDYPGMPIRVVAQAGAGQSVTTTLVSADEKKIDPKLFEVPADYKPMKMPAMPQMPPVSADQNQP